MRIVVQRVSSASVKTEGKVVGRIKKGLFVLIGVEEGDKEEDAYFLANKLFKLRIMADNEGKMNLSLKEAGGKILAVSQFTLCADTKAGNRPSFIKAAKPELALSLYNLFIDKLRELGAMVETGSFGNYMEIKSTLDGPVTIIMDS
jgi:D-tyrosyl-tRNA(Tyr) deacylase